MSVPKTIVKSIKRRRLLIFPLFLFFALLLPILLYSILFLLFYQGKIYPGISVLGYEVSGLTPGEASEFLSQKIKTESKIVVLGKEQSFEIPLTGLEFSYNFSETTLTAYNKFRDLGFVESYFGALRSPFENVDLELSVKLNDQKLDNFISVIAGQISTEQVEPSLELVNNNVVINKGTPGEDLDKERLKNEIKKNLKRARFVDIKAPLTYVDNSLDKDDISELKESSEKLIGKSLNFKFEFQNFIYKDSQIIPLLLSKNKGASNKLDALINDLAKEVDREPQNSVFVFQDGKVTEFAPSKDGVKIESEKLKGTIFEGLSKLVSGEVNSLDLEIPTQKTPAQITTASINNLGIKELLGRGSSKFVGSISSRVYNIGHASSKFNGVLVAPGEVFSFNQTLGDVSAYTGYKQAYIIQDGKTVLGDGGGVCQVSSTLFRAVLNAGLDIIERRAHSYRVGYYEQGSPPGFDATVFDPTTDFKFKNDTPGHILIQTVFDPKKQSLIFELYGTSDGRVASTTKPVVSAVTPPPEDLYTDDPTLPSGVVKQIDYKAWGAKVIFSYKVERGGETIREKTFISNYRPWQAKFLRGTGTFI